VCVGVTWLLEVRPDSSSRLLVVGQRLVRMQKRLVTESDGAVCGFSQLPDEPPTCLLYSLAVGDVV
jgi:hypothetical protein